MTGRVEICGIDTSSLPKLTHKENLELLKKAQSGCKDSKDKFVMANLRLVLSIVKRFSGSKASTDDIFQIGCIGLLKALDNFNTDYDLRFSTYAVPMVMGEIRRFLRDSSPIRVSRSIRDNAYKILQERNRIESETNAEASLDDIALALNMPITDVVNAINAISTPASLCDPIFNDGDDTITIGDQLADDKFSMEKFQENVMLSDALDKLSQREKQILLLRFYRGKTQIEVSEEIGISQAQVSRLEKNALKNARKVLE